MLIRHRGYSHWESAMKLNLLGLALLTAAAVPALTDPSSAMDGVGCGGSTFRGGNHVLLINSCPHPIVITMYDDGGCRRGCPYHLMPGKRVRTTYEGRFQMEWK